MIYLGLLLFLVLVGIIKKISPYLYLALGGVILIFHPLLLFKNITIFTNYLSNFVFLLFLSFFILIILEKILKKDYVFGLNPIVDFIQNKNKLLLISFILIILIFALPISISTCFLFLVIIFGFIYKINARIYTGVAILFLVAMGTYFILGKIIIAQEISTWAYYLLLMSVFFGVLETRKKKREKN